MNGEKASVCARILLIIYNSQPQTHAVFGPDSMSIKANGKIH